MILKFTQITNGEIKETLPLQVCTNLWLPIIIVERRELRKFLIHIQVVAPANKPANMKGELIDDLPKL